MKIKVNNYEAKDVLRIMREWTELTQKEFAESIDLSAMSIYFYEAGRRHCLFDTFMKIADKHGITIILEKNSSKKN